MTGRERISAAFKGEKADRLGVYEHVWGESVVRWKKEGLPEDADLGKYFDYDIQNMGWFNLSMQLPSETVEEDDTYITTRDANGVVAKRHKTESGHTPHWIDHLFKGREEWEKYKDRLVMNEDRIDRNLIEKKDEFRNSNKFVCLAGIEPYEAFWPVFGQVRIFELMLDDPELIKEIFLKTAGLIIDIIKRYIELGVYFDGVWFYGDMGYRNGTLFSQNIYDNLIFESHKKLCDFVHSLGKPTVLHSCGCIKAFLPKLIEAGFDAIQPLEVKCDQDIRELHKIHGDKILYFGNIDVRKLSGTKKDVEEEIIPKLEYITKRGRYIFHSDHSIPPTISFENYKYALEIVRSFKI